MDRRNHINIYHVEVQGQSGAWLDLVAAVDEKSMREKVEETYGKYHIKITVIIKDIYDYIIE